MLTSKNFHRLKFYSRETVITLALLFIVIAVTGRWHTALLITAFEIVARIILSYAHKQIWKKLTEDESPNDQDYEI